MNVGLDTEAWLATLSAEEVMAGISTAIEARDWLAVEGLMKILALKDPEKAQIILDTMTIVAARKG